MPRRAAPSRTESVLLTRAPLLLLPAGERGRNAMAPRGERGGTKFTTIMNAVTLVSVLCPHLPFVRGVATVSAIFVWACFHTAYLVDRTCFGRMRARNRWTVGEFHVGNFLFHHLPLAMTLRDSPVPTLFEVAVSVVVFLCWLLFATEGSMYPDQVYVRMPRNAWNVCYAAGCLACASYCCCAR